MQKAYREKLIRAFPRAFESEIIDFPASRRGIESKRRRLTSNKPGVWKDRRSNHWEASCGSDPISGKRIKKGGFRTEKEAIEWRDREKQKLQHRIYEARRLSDGESMECIWGIKLPEDHGLLHPGIISRCFEEYVANHPEANPTLVGEFVRWWVNEKKHTGSSEHTWRSAESRLRPFVKQHANRTLTSITKEECADFVRDPSVSITTQKNKLTAVKDFFNCAQREGKISMERSAHPALFITLPKHSNRRSNHIPWTISQFERLLRFLLENEGIYHCTGYLLVGTYAGLRTEEFNKIYYGRDGIDLDSGEIYISDEIGKTRRTRCFEMRPELLVALKRLREWNRSWYKNLPAKAGRPYTNDGKLVREKDIVAMRTKLHLPEEKGGAGLPVFHRGGEPRITPALP